jgi:hypothetical protein
VLRAHHQRSLTTSTTWSPADYPQPTVPVLSVARTEEQGGQFVKRWTQTMLLPMTSGSHASACSVRVLSTVTIVPRSHRDCLLSA